MTPGDWLKSAQEDLKVARAALEDARGELLTAYAGLSSGPHSSSLMQRAEACYARYQRNVNRLAILQRALDERVARMLNPPLIANPETERVHAKAVSDAVAALKAVR